MSTLNMTLYDWGAGTGNSDWSTYDIHQVMMILTKGLRSVNDIVIFSYLFYAEIQVRGRFCAFYSDCKTFKPTSCDFKKKCGVFSLVIEHNPDL